MSSFSLSSCASCPDGREGTSLAWEGLWSLKGRTDVAVMAVSEVGRWKEEKRCGED